MNPKAKSVRSDGFARWRRRFDAIVRADIGCGRKNFDAGSRRIMLSANNADSADAVNSAQRHVLKSTTADGTSRPISHRSSCRRRTFPSLHRGPSDRPPRPDRPSPPPGHRPEPILVLRVRPAEPRSSDSAAEVNRSHRTPTPTRSSPACDRSARRAHWPE